MARVGVADAAIQWAGVYHPAYRISQALESGIASDSPAVDVTVQIVDGPAGAAAAQRYREQAIAVLGKEGTVGGLRNIGLRIPASLILTLAAEPEVLWIEPRSQPVVNDERADQIMANNVELYLACEDNPADACDVRLPSTPRHRTHGTRSPCILAFCRD